MSEWQSHVGRWMYQLLPPLYRDADNPQRDASQRITVPGDLARWLDACGLLLDELRATLDQRLADNFVDAPSGGKVCQDWTLPYIARLLNVDLVSPDAAGRRAEVAQAIRWRQRKGTLVAAEEIGAAITGDEVELQEGWRRVACTARPGTPLLPAAAYGLVNTGFAGWRSRVLHHPGLPVVTPDLRRHSQALRDAEPGAPGSRRSRLGSVDVVWRQGEPHGAPVHPGGFDDVSRRTVDLRRPGPRCGHAHPRRLLGFVPMPRGRFAAPVARCATVADLRASPYVRWTEESSAPASGQAWSLRIERRGDCDVVFEGDLDLGALLPTAAADVTVALSGLQLRGLVSLPRGRLHLDRVAAASVTVTSTGIRLDDPACLATATLIGTLSVPSAHARLVACTLRQDARCLDLAAHNTLFAGKITGPATQPLPGRAVLTHCRVPPTLVASGDIQLDNCHAEVPLFFAAAAGFGRDAGVLRPDNPEWLLTGADDGGEVGCHHGGRAGRPVLMTEAQTLTLGPGTSLRDIVFAAPVRISAASVGALRLERVAMQSLDIETPAQAIGGEAVPLLEAVSCLFGSLRVRPALARLEFCTVLGAATFTRVQASDCLFAGTLTVAAGTAAAPSCLRYSRLPPERLSDPALPQNHCTAERPSFHASSFADGVAGRAGCAALHWAAPAALRQGAEDGGELGVHHDDRHVLRMAAALDKLADHLPAGLMAVLVPDDSLALLPANPEAYEATGGPA